MVSESISVAVPRPEHPRPQFKRKDWINLNGEWTFTFDPGKSGMQREFFKCSSFDRKIIVPFCPESQLSGVVNRDFIDVIWYHRKLHVPVEWSGQRVLLNFGAVDYETEVYVNGNLAGRHFGGSSSFSLDISSLVIAGQMHDLVLHVHDNLRSGMQPSGKQSLDYYSSGCFYTRVTGIWQTVWLEAVSPLSLENCRIYPNYDSKAFHLFPKFRHLQEHCTLTGLLLDGDKRIAEATYAASSGTVLTLSAADLKAWSPSDPFLYNLVLEVRDKDGALSDRVESYCGLRKIHTEGDMIFLNNEPLYLRFVLDQGYYEDGIWTAPSDEALKRDIELGLEAGFNGARLHQKVFEERYHFWADKLGYLTWAESPSWGLDVRSEVAARNFLTEWTEVVLRDANHPSILTWTTLNETWDISNRKQHTRLHLDAYNLTKALDPSRPINNASGGAHVRTDIYTVHIYEQDPVLLGEMLKPDELAGVFRTLGDKEVEYEGQPYVIDEFGGIKWITDEQRLIHSSWGYGHTPQDLESFYQRLDGQISSLLNLEHASGYCYTQLTDVEQEQNGIYHYDRSQKFDMERIRRIFSRTPRHYKRRTHG